MTGARLAAPLLNERGRPHGAASLPGGWLHHNLVFVLGLTPCVLLKLLLRLGRFIDLVIRKRKQQSE